MSSPLIILTTIFRGIFDVEFLKISKNSFCNFPKKGICKFSKIFYRPRGLCHQAHFDADPPTVFPKRTPVGVSE